MPARPGRRPGTGSGIPIPVPGNIPSVSLLLFPGGLIRSDRFFLHYAIGPPVRPPLPARRALCVGAFRRKAHPGADCRAHDSPHATARNGGAPCIARRLRAGVAGAFRRKAHPGAGFRGTARPARQGGTALRWVTSEAVSRPSSRRRRGTPQPGAGAAPAPGMPPPCRGIPEGDSRTKVMIFPPGQHLMFIPFRDDGGLHASPRGRRNADPGLICAAPAAPVASTPRMDAPSAGHDRRKAHPWTAGFQPARGNEASPGGDAGKMPAVPGPR